MSATIPFTGADFTIQSVEAVGMSSVRVRFTQDPLAANPAGAHDGLNPAQYSLAGPASNYVATVTVVPDDPQALDLILAAPLVAGTWILTAFPTLETATGRPLQAPNSASFDVVVVADLAPVNGGAVNDSAEKLLRKHLPSALKGKAWDALIAALAVGDKLNWELAKSVFDQLFKSSASGLYLDRKNGDDGVARPLDIGMPDDLFRKLGIKVTAAKLTPEVLLEILEIFYGSDSLRAHVETELEEPFGLLDGQTLEVVTNENEVIPVTFKADDFSLISQATALEVAAVLTRAFRMSKSKAFAVASKDPVTGDSKVRIYSSALGLASSVRVRGGTAQKALHFETQVAAVDPLTNPATLVWNVTAPEAGKVRMKITGAVALDMGKLEIGDYVLVSGGGFQVENRGWFTIDVLDIRYVGGVLEQYIEFANNGVQQLGLAQIALDDVLFFRPTKKVIHNGGSRTVVLAQTTAGHLDVSMPATTQTVGRTLGTGAYPDNGVVDSPPGPYLMDQDGIAITSISTTTTSDLFKGSQYAVLNVTDATAFPDEEGWLVIGFGTDNAAYPIRYLGLYSATALILDYQQKMPATNLAGADVTLLKNQGSYTFPQPQERGLFYLTASSAGRVAAENQLDKTVAAGVEVDVEIVYPGDRGLGGEGLGSTGRKCSDKVAIWGGDELDAELAAARGKS